MPIEFRCTCGQRLRVADENAGKLARCPECQTMAQIPGALPSAAAGGAEPLDQSFDPPGHTQPPDPFSESTGGYRGSQMPPPRSPNPYASPMAQNYQRQAHPAIGGGKVVPTAVDPSAVLSFAWEIWKRHLGLLVGVTVVIFALSFLTAGINEVLRRMFEQNGNQDAAVFVPFGINIFSNLIHFFLSIGQSQIALKLARNRPAEFAELFGGGSFFFPALGGSILFGLALSVGLLFCLVPGIIVALLLWPFFLLIVDGKTDVIESFSVAYQLGKINALTTFLLWLVSIGIWLAGVFAFCVGLLFAAPLITMMWTCAYLMMAGQLTSYSK